jgi:ferritin-like metal-binding protein YciE
MFRRMLRRMPMNTLKELLVTQLNELYAAERRAAKLMPELSRTASDQQLAALLRRDGDSAKERERRLDDVFRELGVRPHPARAETEGMKGLARDCVDLAKATRSDSGVRDAAIIAGVQHIAHDRIAGYGCARSWVELLGFQQSVARLQLALTEERKLDADLSALAAGINKAAAVAAGA